MNWSELVGKKIVALRGREPEGEAQVPLEFILFDDGKTYIELREQDSYEYHDCASDARLLDLRQDSRVWASMLKMEFNFRETAGGSFPFC